MWEGVVGLGTRLSDEERARIAELAATRLPSRLIAKEVGRSHRAVWSYVQKLRQRPPAERRRSPLDHLNAPQRAASGPVPRFRGRCGDRVARLTIGPSDRPRITTARAHLCLRTGAVGRWSAPSRARGSATSDAEGMASATPGTGWTMPSPPSLPPPLPSGRLEDLTHYSQPTPGRNVGSRYSQPSCQANSSATSVSRGSPSR